MYTTRANHKKMEKSFNDLRAYIDEKFNDINKKYDELKATVINDTIERFKEVLKEEMSKINDKLEGKIHQLCQDKSFLQEQISELKKQNSAIAASCEETEQYSRRLCLRIDGVPSVDKETSSDVLEKVKEICAESNLEIPDSNLDRAHRIGKSYFDKIKKVNCKSIIVRFNTFRHRTLLYRAKKDIKQKKGYKIRLDLTKRRYLMLLEANKLASDNQNANFCYADVNCRLKIRWNDNQEDFFDTLEDLRDLLDRNC